MALHCNLRPSLNDYYTPARERSVPLFDQNVADFAHFPFNRLPTAAHSGGNSPPHYFLRARDSTDLLRVEV